MNFEWTFKFDFALWIFITIYNIRISYFCKYKRRHNVFEANALYFLSLNSDWIFLIFILF